MASVCGVSYILSTRKFTHFLFISVHAQGFNIHKKKVWHKLLRIWIKTRQIRAQNLYAISFEKVVRNSTNDLYGAQTNSTVAAEKIPESNKTNSTTAESKAIMEEKNRRN